VVSRLAFVVWLGIWVWIAAPWRSFRPTPSFRFVEVIPFAIPGARTQILNLLAFVPLGFLGVRLGWRPGTILLVAAGLSGATEFLQLFSATRYPSTTDLILNTVGALVGMSIARYSIGRREAPVKGTKS
jgi:glycopeptide antibiotics resistance protein